MSDNNSNPNEAAGLKNNHISRRKLLTTLGVAGAAVTIGMNVLNSNSAEKELVTQYVFNIKDYYAVDEDDTRAIQAAIDDCHSHGGGIVYIPPGTYMIGSTIQLFSNISLLGAGSSSKLKAADSLPNNKGMISNPNVSGAVDSYEDHHIRISQLTLEGNISTVREASLLIFTKAAEIMIDHCNFQNSTHIGAAFGGCFKVEINYCSFLHLGRPKPSPVSAPAIWTDRSSDGSAAKFITIDHCYFEDNNWSGCYFMPEGGRISNCIFINNGESSIFSNQHGKDIQYTNNYIEGAQRSNISASGLESGSFNIVIYGNHIKNCENDGISLTDVKNAIVSNNIISNNGQDPLIFPMASGVGIIAYDTVPELNSDHIQIIKNRIMDNQANKTQSYNIVVGGIGLPVTNVVIRNNDVSDYKLAPIQIDSNLWGSGSFMENNLGHASEHPRMGQFKSPNASGIYIVSDIGFKPRRLELRAVLPGGQIYECESLFVEDQGICHSKSSYKSHQSSYTALNKAIMLYDDTGMLICEAMLHSRDIDGFSLLYTIYSVRPEVMWIASP